MAEAWGGIDRAARLRVLEALAQLGETSAREVARATGRNASAMHQMLAALRQEGLVDCRMKGSRYLWRRTALEVPDQFVCSTAQSVRGENRVSARWDHSALCEAMQIPTGMSDPVKPTRFHVIKDEERGPRIRPALGKAPEG